MIALVNPLHPNINMDILHTVFYTFPKVLARRVCLSIKRMFSLWSFPLFSWPYCVIQGLSCWEKFDAGHSQLSFTLWLVQKACATLLTNQMQTYETIVTWTPAFSRALRRLHVFTASPYWPLAMLTFGLVGRSDDFGFGFFLTPNWKLLQCIWIVAVVQSRYIMG